MSLRQTIASWCWLFIILPIINRSFSKPRLHPILDRLDLLLLSPRKCRHTTRFSPSELHALARDIGIDWNEPASGNWRFSPRHRLVLFLITIGNAYPSRKLSLFSGWAANAVLNSWRYHIEQIVAVLDVAGGGQQTERSSLGLLGSLLTLCCVLPLIS